MPNPHGTQSPRRSGRATAIERAKRDAADQAAAAMYYRANSALPAHLHRLAMLEKKQPAFIEMPINDDTRREVVERLVQRSRDDLRAEAKRRGVTTSGTKLQIAERLASLTRITRVGRRNPRIASRVVHVAQIEAQRDRVVNQLRKLSTPTAVEWFATSPDVLTSSEQDVPGIEQDDRIRVAVDAYKRLIEDGYELEPISDVNASFTLDEIARACRQWRAGERHDRGAGTQPRSAPMSKAELARRILNWHTAHPRDVRWALYDLRQVTDRTWTVSLVGLDPAMLARLEKPRSS